MCFFRYVFQIWTPGQGVLLFVCRRVKANRKYHVFPHVHHNLGAEPHDRNWRLNKYVNVISCFLRKVTLLMNVSRVF